MKIYFEPFRKSCSVKNGESILDVAKTAGVFIDAYCSGNGSCGKCKIQIISGKENLNPIQLNEKKFLSENEIKYGYRLACKTFVRINDNYKDIVVKISKSENSLVKKNMNILPKFFLKNTDINKKPIVFGKKKFMSRKSVLDAIFTLCGISNRNVNIRVLKSISDILKSNEEEITVVLKNENIVSIEKGDTSSHSYGVAFDIGTTTVVGMLWDLEKGILIDSEAMANPQGIYGSDVISRILFASASDSNLEEIWLKIIESINKIINILSDRNGLNRNFIYDMTVVGNTAMTHIFLGINPDSIAVNPFVPIFSNGCCIDAVSAGIDINPNCDVYVLPNIGGQVGSDITACILYTDIFNLCGVSVVVDIGTNGEILAAVNGKVFAASTAAGPAFEGAGIYCGIRAGDGAIEKIRIQEKYVYTEVIGNGEARGICGSGIIDAVAQLVSVGIVDKNGYMLEKDEALQKGLCKELCDRIIETKEGTAFIIYYSKNNNKNENIGDIIITQKDIRAVQLAKGAVSAGVKTLLKNIGVFENDIDRFIVAGAFGNYIDKKNAIKIKLFPDISTEKIFFVGNAAGSGASMALLSVSERKRAEICAEKTEHIELSESEYFQDEFINSMNF